MSYILDALKKSEEQRNNGNISIPTSNARQLPARKPRLYFLPLIAIAVLLFFILIGFYLSQTRQETAVKIDKAEAAQLQLTTGEPSDDIQSFNDERSNAVFNDKPFHDAYANLKITETLPSDESFDDNSDNNRGNIKTENTIESYGDVANLSESDAFIQNQIPSLNYSSHWYGTDSKNSTIIINNHSLKEGGWINNNIQIEKILSEETVFKIEKSRFKLRSLQNWSH